MPVQIAAIGADGISPLDLGAVAEVFGINRGLAETWYEMTLCAAEPGPITTRGGMSVDVKNGLEAVDRADIVIALPVESYLHQAPPPQVIEALAAAYSRGARVASLCVGAFAVAAAGLLDGREATTHWRACSQLAAAYPSVRVIPGRLYIDAGQILTSGGVAAGLDLCLHIVRGDYGAEIANQLSRRIVMAPHRDGGQAQYIEQPSPDRTPEPIRVAMLWALANLDQPLTLAAFADMAHLSIRTFGRRFRKLTGTTPHQWLIAQRLDLSRRLLESTDLPVDQVARQAGFPQLAVASPALPKQAGNQPNRLPPSLHPQQRYQRPRCTVRPTIQSQKRAATSVTVPPWLITSNASCSRAPPHSPPPDQPIQKSRIKPSMSQINATKTSINRNRCRYQPTRCHRSAEHPVTIITRSRTWCP